MRLYRPNTTTAHQRLTVTGSAATLASLGLTMSARTEGIVIQVEDGDLRYTVNGTTTPTSTVGFLLRDIDLPLPLSKAEAENLKVVSAAGGTVYLQAAEYSEMP